MRVKICGITNLEDALYAIDCGADALGFVFYNKSPRFISYKKAKYIIDKLPPFVERVGLFVDEKTDNIDNICKEINISLAQLHFDIDENFLDKLSIKSLPVIRATKKEDILRFKNRFRLVDAFTKEYGGVGKRVRLEWFDGIEVNKIILAGGLNSSNLAEVKQYNFYGVDVSSGIERRKGVKDKQKIKEFISVAKQS